MRGERARSLRPKLSNRQASIPRHHLYPKPYRQRIRENLRRRQFRLPAQLANRRGDLVEIVAGHVEAGEKLIEAAHRECLEEIGVAPVALTELFTYLPTPGASDEQITLFLGIVDAAQVPDQAGAAAEREETRPLRVSIDAALAALAGNAMHNGLLVLALHWLALNRGRLKEIGRSGR